MINDGISDGLVRHNISLLRYDAKLRRQIRSQLRAMQESITAQLGAVDFSNVAKKARLESLLKQVDGIVKGNYKGMNKAMLGEMQDLAVAENGFATQHLNKAIGVDIASAGLSPAALKVMAKDSAIFGAPAAEHWGRQSALMRRRFADEMRQGYLLGESTQDLVRRVRGSATGSRQLVEMANGVTKSMPVFSGGIMDVTTKQAEALVRTSVQSVANEVRLNTYMKNTDVIGSVQAQVTLDSKTSDICQAHGNVPDEWTLPDFEPVGASNSFTGPPPWHFNCRSSLVPITKSWEELQKQGEGTATRKQKAIARKLDNNQPKRMRASMNGRVPAGTGYGDWLKKQPLKIQREVLGPTKLKLWKQGKLNLTQQIDQTGRPLSLKKMGLVDAKVLADTAAAAQTGHAFIPPPQVARLTRLEGLEKGMQFEYTGQVYQVHKVIPDGVEALPWSTRTGKFVTARNRVTLKHGETPVKPVKPTKPTTVKPTTEKPPLTTRVKRDKDFDFNGEYHVTLTDGQKFRMYRDTGTGWWYEALPTNTLRQKPLGFTRVDAVEALEKRLKIKPTTVKPPIVKPTPTPKPKPVKTTVGKKYPGLVNTADPSNYRALAIGDTFKDAAGQVYMVYGHSTKGVKVLLWSEKTGKFLSKRNGKTIGYTSEPAATVKQYKQATRNSTTAVRNLFHENPGMGNKIPIIGRLRDNMNVAIETMGKNGFNPVLARQLKANGKVAEVFNMAKKQGKQMATKVNPWGNSYKTNASGTYWNGRRAIGMVDADNVKWVTDTWVHEFGHFMDYQVFRNPRRILGLEFLNTAGNLQKLKRMSPVATEKWKEIDTAYKAMIAEYKAASKAVGKSAGLRLKKGIISERQQANNYWELSKHLKNHTHSSYSLYNDREWFAEMYAAYFNRGGSRALMAKNQPATHNLMQALMSKDMEPLWKELWK